MCVQCDPVLRRDSFCSDLPEDLGSITDFKVLLYNRLLTMHGAQGQEALPVCSVNLHLILRKDRCTKAVLEFHHL